MRDPTIAFSDASPEQPHSPKTASQFTHLKHKSRDSKQTASADIYSDSSKPPSVVRSNGIRTTDRSGVVGAQLSPNKERRATEQNPSSNTGDQGLRSDSPGDGVQVERRLSDPSDIQHQASGKLSKGDSITGLHTDLLGYQQLDAGNGAEKLTVRRASKRLTQVRENESEL